MLREQDPESSLQVDALEIADRARPAVLASGRTHDVVIFSIRELDEKHGLIAATAPCKFALDHIGGFVCMQYPCVSEFWRRLRQ